MLSQKVSEDIPMGSSISTINRLKEISKKDQEIQKMWKMNEKSSSPGKHPQVMINQFKHVANDNVSRENELLQRKRQVFEEDNFKYPIVSNENTNTEESVFDSEEKLTRVKIENSKYGNESVLGIIPGSYGCLSNEKAGLLRNELQHEREKNISLKTLLQNESTKNETLKKDNVALTGEIFLIFPQFFVLLLRTPDITNIPI